MPVTRHRLGAVRYSDVQFPDKFLQRYTPWREGEFYSTDKLLNLQQALVDADYFSAVAVTPDLEHAKDAVVPIDVMLVPAKRTVYTASVYVSTDSGPGTQARLRAALAQQARPQAELGTCSTRRACRSSARSIGSRSRDCRIAP